MILNHILPTKTIPAEVFPFTVNGPEQAFVLVFVSIVVVVGLSAIFLDLTDN